MQIEEADVGEWRPVILLKLTGAFMNYYLKWSNEIFLYTYQWAIGESQRDEAVLPSSFSSILCSRHLQRAIKTKFTFLQSSPFVVI